MDLDCGHERHPCLVIVTELGHDDKRGIPELLSPLGWRRSILCDDLDEIEAKFTWPEEWAQDFIRFPERNPFRQIDVVRVSDLTPQKLSEMYDAAIARLTGLGRSSSPKRERVGLRMDAERHFQREKRVPVEKIKKKRLPGGVQMQRRVRSGTARGQR